MGGYSGRQSAMLEIITLNCLSGKHLPVALEKNKGYKTQRTYMFVVSVAATRKRI